MGYLLSGVCLEDNSLSVDVESQEFAFGFVF